MAPSETFGTKMKVEHHEVPIEWYLHSLSYGLLIICNIIFKLRMEKFHYFLKHLGHERFIYNLKLKALSIFLRFLLNFQIWGFPKKIL